jgi:hypothetical protein
MKSKHFWKVARCGVLVLALGISALAQTPKHMRFRGLFRDYTPANNPATVAGPWEVGGEWSLELKGESDNVEFSAALTMVHSDLGVTGGDLNTPKARNAHTHHVTLVDGTVEPLTNGFRVTGTAIITGNGIFPPPFGGSSSVQIDITGGNGVTYSNIQMTFSGDAPAHFGAQPINGVVRSAREVREFERHDRR